MNGGSFRSTILLLAQCNMRIANSIHRVAKLLPRAMYSRQKRPERTREEERILKNLIKTRLVY